MVTLRQPNNPATPPVVLNALKAILPSGTQLAAGSADGTGLSQIYIDNKMALAFGAFPAVHLSGGRLKSLKQSRATYHGTTSVVLWYYDRWDSQPQSIDGVLATLSLDILRMYSTIESNAALSYANVPVTQTITAMTLSPYLGEIDHDTIPGILLVYRKISIDYVLPPYDA
jgi:hypothetical protein